MRARRAGGMAAALAGLAGLTACGADEDRVNRERPAVSINVSAAIVDGRMLVSPRRFGAGPIRLIVTNQTRSPQAVTFATEEVGSAAPGRTGTTAPVDPSTTATLELDVRPGRYAVSATDDAIERASVKVGAPRPSAQNELSLP